MFDNLLQKLVCEKCGEGELFFNYSATYDVYATPSSFEVEEIENAVDNIMNRFLIFSCSLCNETTRHTFKEIDKLVRKRITENILRSIVRAEILPSVNIMDKNFIYCGRCSGFDGSGACPRSIYDECKLKRLPYGLY